MNQNNLKESEGYGIRRYFTPTSLTASQTAKKRKVRANGRSMSPLTYHTLLDEQSRQNQLCGANEQTANNRATALRNFMRANGMCADDVVGDEMRLRHPEAIERFVGMLQNDGRPLLVVIVGRDGLHMELVESTGQCVVLEPVR